MIRFQDLPFSIQLLLEDASATLNQTPIGVMRCVVATLAVASDHATADACGVSESLVAMIRDEVARAVAVHA